MDKIGECSELEYVVFHVSPAWNRYESVACTKSKTEVLVSGSLDQLAIYLSEAKKLLTSSSNGSFKLQIPGKLKSPWFTKSIVVRFLHIVNSFDVVKSADGILNEISQLEDTRKFHVSLYFKDQQGITGGSTGGSSFSEAEAMVGQHSSETTKSELIRAVELRLSTLQDELLALLNKAAGSDLSSKQILDLISFLQHFENAESRSSLLKYLEVISKHFRSEDHDESSPDNKQAVEEDLHDTSELEPQDDCDVAVTLNHGVSPAKLAQVERLSSEGEDDETSESSEGHAVVDRSRAFSRSGSHRRSASPMRRVQIGRSGSRRSPAIAIKSLSYFPVKDRVIGKDDEKNGDDEELDQSLKKHESNVRRMSVQDAINLFESKQKDQNLDAQRKKAAGLFGSTKSVLRRWSAGMGDSLANQSQDHSSGASLQSTPIDTVRNSEQNEINIEPDVPVGPLNAVEIITPVNDNLKDVKVESTLDDSQQLEVCLEEHNEQEPTSADWNHQKEVELNQMILKLMEGNPNNNGGINVDGPGIDAATVKKSGSYIQYKEKRDAKLRGENSNRQTVNEAQLKALQDRLEKSKSVKISKSDSIPDKRNSPAPHRPRRNSSPSMLSKESPKVAAAKKASPKPSPSQVSTRSSGTLTKTTNLQKPKSSPARSLSVTPPSRQKVPTASTAPMASPTSGRSAQPSKSKKEHAGTRRESTKCPEDRIAKTVIKPAGCTAMKIPSAKEEKSEVATKPSLYTKGTKKSSVVPLEAKPLRKATAKTVPRASPTPKSKSLQPDVSSKDSESVAQSEDKEPTSVAIESTTKALEVDLAQKTNAEDNLECSMNNDLTVEKIENMDPSLAQTVTSFDSPTELTATVVNADEDLGISSAAWVDVEHVEAPCLSQEKQITDIDPPGIAPLQSTSPRIRHSLSQMLQAEVHEPEIVEWGNAEVPPALVFQKDSPKGFKRLLKFARKNKGDLNKGETNSNGWLSPPVCSEGEDEVEEAKDPTSRNGDVLSRKVTLQAKGYNQQKSALTESLDGGNSSNRSLDGHKLPALTTTGPTSSTKVAKSFFSLSNFRSSKSNESRIR